MSIIVSNCQHCDEQQFRTLSCVHYTIFTVVKSDLFIRALLLDRILVTEETTRTTRVHIVIIQVYINVQNLYAQHYIIHRNLPAMNTIIPAIPAIIPMNTTQTIILIGFRPLTTVATSSISSSSPSMSSNISLSTLLMWLPYG